MSITNLIVNVWSRTCEICETKLRSLYFIQNARRDQIFMLNIVSFDSTNTKLGKRVPHCVENVSECRFRLVHPHHYERRVWTIASCLRGISSRACP